jgi:predicted RNase H-like nuclease (RuvC/YqgF family)
MTMSDRLTDEQFEKVIADEAHKTRIRFEQSGGSATDGWIAAVRPLYDMVRMSADVLRTNTENLKAVETQRDTLTAEVKRLTDTAEHLGATLKPRCEEVALLKREIASQDAAYQTLRKDAEQQRARATRLEAGIDAIVERYSDLQRGAR